MGRATRGAVLPAAGAVVNPLRPVCGKEPGLMVAGRVALAPVSPGRCHDGRGDAARQDGDEGVSPRPDRHREGVPRRLVPQRRSGGVAAGRLHRDQGPEGDHHLGRREPSLEVEEVLHRHPAIMEGAVVAKPGPTRGETPCAFVTLKLEATPASPTSRRRAPSCFGPLPKTSTGKQEIHPARAGEGGGLT